MLSALLDGGPMRVLAPISALGLLLAGIAGGCSSTPTELVGLTGSGGSGANEGNGASADWELYQCNDSR